MENHNGVTLDEAVIRLPERRIRPAHPTPPGMYRTVDVARLTRASYRQIDYWCRHGWVPGAGFEPGSGYARLFTQEQLDHIALLVEAAFIKHCSIPDIADELARLRGARDGAAS